MRRRWQRDFLTWELWSAVLATLIASAVVWGLDARRDEGLLDGVAAETRSAFYAVMASIWGVLLGFAVTAASIVLATSADARVSFMRSSTQYPKVYRVFFSAVRWLGLATAWAVICLLLDTGVTPRGWMVAIFVFTALISTARFARAVWVLEQTIAVIVGVDQREAGGQQPPGRQRQVWTGQRL